MNKAVKDPVYHQGHTPDVPTREPFAGTIGELMAKELPKLRPQNLDAAAGSTNESQSPSSPPAISLEEAIAQRRHEEEEAMRELTLERLSEYEITLAGDLPEPRPIIARTGGAIVGSEGNISAVVGEAKSRKSFLCTAIVGDLLNMSRTFANGFRGRVVRTLWIDTEQSELHVRKLARRISALTEWNDPATVHCMLKIYALREKPPKERLQLLREAIGAWQPRLVVIDGVADLQLNTNDLEESERIVTELMTLSTIYCCHILCVLHTNPNSDKARGHLGSALQRKAETVLYVHKSGEKSLVEPQFCRNEPFDRFAFEISNEQTELGLPQPAELPSEEADEESIVVRLLREEYGGTIERIILVRKLSERLGIGEQAAQMRISRAIKRNEIVAEEKMLHLPVTR